MFFEQIKHDLSRGREGGALLRHERGGLTLPGEIFQSGPAWLPSSLPSAAGVNLVN